MPGKTGKEKEISFKPTWAFVAPGVFLLDRLTKSYILATFSEGDGAALWPGVFHLTRVNNTGAAFGIFRGSSRALAVFTILSVLVVAAYWARRSVRSSAVVSMRRVWAWAAVLGGAAGNIFDRFRYGYVIDFLDFRIWPVFNFADAAICIGVFLIFLDILGEKKRSADAS